MARALKVFRTPIGFHDAYVAAPSRKAALRAWGADADLFARGAAEQVTDPVLMAEPLAHPGTIIRKVRGTLDEHLAALPDPPKRARRVPEAPAREDSAARGSANPAKPTPPPKPRPKPKPKPRPSRDDLDAAEQAVEDADVRFEAARRDIAAREAALAAERRALEVAHEHERRALDVARAAAEAQYKEALARWRADEV